MGNTKHTIAALATVAIIGTLGVKQAYDFKASNRLAALLSNNAEEEIILTADDVKVDPEIAEQLLNETYTQEEIETITEKKSELQNSYVLLTYGTLDVYESPSEEAQVIDSLVQCSDVKVMESTEGWYKVSYGGGKTGYVSKKLVDKYLVEIKYEII